MEAISSCHTVNHPPHHIVSQPTTPRCKCTRLLKLSQRDHVMYYDHRLGLICILRSEVRFWTDWTYWEGALEGGPLDGLMEEADWKTYLRSKMSFVVDEKNCILVFTFSLKPCILGLGIWLCVKFSCVCCRSISQVDSQNSDVWPGRSLHTDVAMGTR